MRWSYESSGILTVNRSGSFPTCLMPEILGNKHLLDFVGFRQPVSVCNGLWCGTSNGVRLSSMAHATFLWPRDETPSPDETFPALSAFVQKPALIYFDFSHKVISCEFLLGVGQEGWHNFPIDEYIKVGYEPHFVGGGGMGEGYLGHQTTSHDITLSRLEGFLLSCTHILWQYPTSPPCLLSLLIPSPRGNPPLVETPFINHKK